MKRGRVTTWGMRVLFTLAGLAGLTALAVGWSKLRDVRLRGAFEDALALAPEAESPDTSTSRVADDSSKLTRGVLSYSVWVPPVPLPGMDRRARTFAGVAERPPCHRPGR